MTFGCTAALLHRNNVMKKVAHKYLAHFGKLGAEGAALDAGNLGQKGEALCEIAKLGLLVPPGFVLTVEACKQIVTGKASDEIKAEIVLALARMAVETGCSLGDYKNLLLLA